MAKERYTPSEIEKHWSERWAADGIDAFRPHAEREKFYWFTMFPYPSGDIHIGHWYAMVPSDAGARFKRMNGYNVFFPIGFDAFGLPAENAAIKNNIHPREWTYSNIERMRGQLRSMGAMFAWDNEIVTCEPDYYKWSQWQFLKFYEMGLAYREFAPVDFCPQCHTTLAREQVVGEERLCERCGTPVVRKDLNQWKLRITRYADELLDFSRIEWPEAVRQMQTNWIGRSEGVEFDMPIAGHEALAMRVFTTRPDTVYGVTFAVLSPEHPLVDRITAPERAAAVRAYREAAQRKSEVERMAEAEEKDGVFTGAYALNPLSGERVPVWIADYVMMGYGTGAIMAVPAHDERDFAFARKYDLPVRPVIAPAGHDPGAAGDGGGEAAMEEPYTAKEGSVMIHSGEHSGLAWPQSFARTTEALEARAHGRRTVNYRLRDWLISRQRMWGTPIPIVHCPTCGEVPVPYEDLPVKLPEDAVFKPTGESPLRHHEGFLHAECPRCGGAAERETDTMDTFICSSWYMYGYLSPYWKRGETLHGEDAPWDRPVARTWLPADQYTGGIEHATMHLLYVRFWAMALNDAGVLPVREPILRLFNQGVILGEDNEKMSKSRGNVVNPDELVSRHGADAVRAYLMFIGPWDQGGPWRPSGIEGIVRFLQDVWELGQPVDARTGAPDGGQAGRLTRALHQTLKKVAEDYEQFKFNTLLAALMSYRNLLKQSREVLAGSEAWAEATDKLILMLAPITPFVAEELWQRRHPGPSVHLQPWPAHDPALAAEDVVTLVIQVNGKVRDRMDIPAGTSTEALSEMALERPRVQEFLQDKPVRKVIPVGNKLVNIVA